MSKKVYLQAYFHTLDSLIDDLLRVFPNDVDLITYKTSIGLAQRTNPMLFVRAIFETMGPYEKMIEERNADFFLNFDYSDLVSTDASLGPLFQKLKEMWSTLTPANQKTIWDYITNLSGLVKKCVE
jgi:hypothetical protein